MPSFSDPLPQAETLLLDYAKRLDYHRQGRIAICLAISLLRPDLKKPTDINLTLRKARDLANRYQGEVFHLACEDVVLTLKDANLDIVSTVLNQICRLFRHDPLVQKDGDKFAVRYDMETQYKEFLDFAKTIKHQAGTNGKSPKVRPLELSRIDPALVQTAAGFADPNDLVTLRTIYSFESDSQLLPLVTGISLAEEQVVKLMLEGVDVRSNPQLTPHARRLMECRALSAIPYLAAPWRAPWALQLELETLAGFEFMAFHRAWRTHNQPDAAVDPRFAVSYEQVRSEGKLFNYVRDYIAELDYRLWVSGVDKNALTTLNADELGVEKVKLNWPGTREELGLTRSILIRTIDHIGADRIILVGCDDERSLDLAREMGVTQVEGDYADAVFSGEKTWKVA